VTVPASKAWTAGLVVVLVWLAAMLCVDIARPWTGHHDWNGVLWAQSAHNNLRAGLGTTLGVPTSHYSGPLPIPPGAYYVDHPPVLPLAVTGMFALFGEREWAARLVPIACSLVSVVLLWLLVRSCVGVRVATLSAVVFSLLPMELYFGRMVNHEPCALMLMLGSLLCLRGWKVEGKAWWLGGAVLSIVVGMWVAWPGYIFAGVLGGLLLIRGGRRGRWLAVVLLGLALVSGALFLLYVGQVRPHAWQVLWGAFAERTSLEGLRTFTWGQWLAKQRGYLGSGIPVVAWGLAAAGAGWTLWKRRTLSGLRLLGGAALSLFLTATVFLVVFRDGSYVHDYWGFYFIAPVAMMAGLALDVLLARSWSRDVVPVVRGACVGVAVAGVALLGVRSYQGTRALHLRQWWVLDGVVEEPRYLIPELGRTIYWTFPDETLVLSNLAERGPHLAYYVRRSIFYGRLTYADWAPLLERLGRRAGGLVWLGAPGGEDLWSALPRGRRKVVQFSDLRFGLWRPAAPSAAGPTAQTGCFPDESAAGKVIARWSH